MKQGVVARIIAGIVTIVIAMFLNWLFLPAWNIRSGGLWCFFIVVMIIGCISFLIAEHTTENYIITKILFIGVLFLMVVGILASILSSKMVNAVKYSNLVEIQEKEFQEYEEKISTTEEAKEFPLLDVETAQRLGNRSLSEIKKVSQYEVNNEYNLIYYTGNQYRLSPLEYASIFSVFNNDNIPGYVLVNMETQESQLVELNNPIKYSPSDMFSQDLRRYLRGKYPSYIFDKMQFDIDEQGEAYYVVPVLKPTIGIFGGKKVQSFVIVNTNTGECQEYLPEDLPEWVDHAFSLYYLMGLAENYYAYKGGFLNSLFAKRDVKNISYSYRGETVSEDDEEEENEFVGYNSIFTDEGVSFFTCVVSANNDESALGFILANSKTGEITYYDCAGAEESTAQIQAESLYQNYGYKSSYPLMVSVDGEATYIISLKDKSKINKAYVMINVANYTISVGGETLEEALVKYKEKVFGENQTINPEDLQSDDSNEVKAETKKTSGNIKELYQATQNGTTQFFFVLEGDDNLYISSISNNSRQVQLKVGNTISIEYSMSPNEELVGIVSKIEIK